MRVLVTGSNGLLGYDVIKALEAQRIEHCGISRNEIDLRNISETANFIRDYFPDVIIHCAAFTNVDLAEISPDECKITNVDVTAKIAEVSKEINAKLVYISTDYVFSGQEANPYEANSQKNPLSIYGRTKSEGEDEIIKRASQYFIIRTSWSFGINGDNFVSSIMKLGKTKKTIDVVCDQVGSPTFTRDLSELIVEMIKTHKYGVYHATNEGFCSRAELAEEIFRHIGYEVKVNYISSEDYPTKAERPKNSKLSKKSLDDAGFKRLPAWQESLRHYLSLKG